MTDDQERAIRQAMGGEATSVAWVLAEAEASHDAELVALAALLERSPRRLERARRVAGTSRERQVVALASAYLSGDLDYVDALARDHLSDHPGSLIVSWIAAGAGMAGDLGQA